MQCMVRRALFLLSIAACGPGVIGRMQEPAEAGSEPGRAGEGGLTEAGTAREAGVAASGGEGGAESAPMTDAGRTSVAPGDAQGTSAQRASQFLESLGVCAHIAQGVDAPTESARAMAFAGIHNLRDDGNPATVPAWIAMHEQADVRVCLLTNHDVASTLDMAKRLKAAGALLAVEGPNEPNNFPVRYQGQVSDMKGSFKAVASLQRDLYKAVKAEPSLADVPVFHSSEAGGAQPDDVGLQFLTIPPTAKTLMPAGTQYADYANVHNYVCGHSSKLVDNAAWQASDPTLNGDWDALYVEYGLTWHKQFRGYSNEALMTLPRVTTETGWVTQGTGAISEEQQGRLFLDLFLSAFKRGFSHTFLYMLRDDPVQGYWGLFDTGYRPKKSGTYLHNLTTILADTGERALGKLQYAIEPQPATVHDLLLQKGDGSFALVVWGERFSGGSERVVVSLATKRTLVRIYDPTVSTAPTQTLHDAAEVPLDLSDHPLILAL